MLLAGIACCAPAVADSAYPTARLLVDLARDYGLNRGGEQTEADVEHIRVLLNAAVRLDPANSDAHYYLYELAQLGGDPTASASALERLVRADPTHLTALARWAAAGPLRVTRVEDRVSFLRDLLDKASGDDARAIVLFEQVRLELSRMDRETARRALDEAERLTPDNQDAAILRLMLLAPDAPAAQRIDAMLRVARCHPLDADLFWGIGNLLDQERLFEPAAEFYAYAQRVNEALRAAPPPDQLLALSLNAAARGDLESAIRSARAAMLAGELDATVVLDWLLRQAHRTGESDALRAELGDRYAAIKDADVAGLDELIPAAWFYCTLDLQPQRALMLASSAARRAAGDSRARRILGVAQLHNDQLEAAAQTLTPLLETDEWAAASLASVRFDAGEAAAARRILGGLRRVPASGPIAARIREIAGATSRPADSRLAELIRDFDRRLFSVIDDASGLITAEIVPDTLTPTPGEPWWATFTLTNRADFPVTLGQDGMINPVFLLSFEISGEKTRSYPDLMTVQLNRVRVLPPGKSTSVRQTLDVGPPRRAARIAPTQMLRVSISAMLDPQPDGQGGWRPSLTGQRLRPVYFNRIPMIGDAETIGAIFEGVSDPSEATRFRSLESMAEMLGAAQRGAGRSASFPQARAIKALVACLESSTWETRARALDALQAAGLDERLIRAADAAAQDPHWLVRLLAVRLRARAGAAYLESARGVAVKDADELVRALARSYVELWTAPQPTSSPASAPARE